MIINKSDITTITNGILGDVTFGIADEDQGFLLEMLRNKIYSDPIGAVCREITSNARDSHREADKENLPIDITIKEPNRILGESSLSLMITDYGVGISPDRMSNIFCKYGKSTKRDDNSQTGGYGLGAKTPFAYSDSFSIITIFDKIKYTYTAYIDESRCGKIALLDELPTDECNGTTIIVNIKNDDRLNIEKNLYVFTYLWPIRPNYIGFKIPEPAKINIIDEPVDNIQIVTNSYTSNNQYSLICDGIPYPIDINLIDVKYKTKYDRNFKIHVIAKTGVIDLSVSRETLQYTKTTIDYIKTALQNLENHVKKYLDEYILTSSNYLEACKRFTEISDGESISINGKNIQYYYQWIYDLLLIPSYITKFNGVDPVKGFNMESVMCILYNLQGGELVKTRIKQISIKSLLAYPIFILDELPLSSAKIISILKDYKACYVIRTLRDKDQILATDAFDTYVNTLTSYGVNFKKFSQIPKIKIQSATKQKHTKIHIPTIEMFNNNYVKRTITYNKTNKEIEDEDSFVYLPTDKIRDVYNFNYLEKVKQRMIYVLAKYKHKKLIVVNQKNSRYFEKSNKAISADKFLASIPFSIINQIYNITYANSILKHIKNDIDIVKFIPKIYLKYVELSNQFSTYKNIKTAINIDSDEIIRIYPNVVLNDDIKQLQALYENREKIYPLIKYINLKYSYENTEEKRKDVENYIRLVDKSHEYEKTKQSKTTEVKSII